MITISAIIPARNESKTIGRVIKSVKDSADEIIVVNSCSQDNTSRIASDSGAIVIDTNMPGKDIAIKTGIKNSTGEILVFIDADWENPNSNISKLLVDGLFSDPSVIIAKGYYEEIHNYSENGRLTELCAKPLLKILMPELSHIKNPLSGEFAIRRKDIIDLEFAPGFAVDLDILIQCSKKGTVCQVKLNSKIHKHRNLSELGEDAIGIITTIFQNCQTIDNKKYFSDIIEKISFKTKLTEAQSIQD